MPITVSKITVKNPGLFRHMEDLDKSVAEARFLVHDKMEDVVEYDGSMYMLIAQLCSVMSVYWIMNKVGVAFNKLSAATQAEIAGVVASNNSPADQFEWAKTKLKYTETTSKDEVSKLPKGTKILLYTPRHVSAAIVDDSKWRIYDPEVASAEEYGVKETTAMYLQYATKFLYGK
jgi:hypothetical protein